MNTIPTLNILQFEPEVSLSDLYVNDLSTHLKKNEGFFHKPHRHNFFLCVLFIKGTGKHEIDFNTYEVKPGNVFFLRPGQTHYWTFDTAPEGYIFFHTQDFYELHFTNSKLGQLPFFFSYESSPTLTLSLEQIQLFESKFKEINDEYYNKLPFKKQKIASLIHTTYIDLARHYTSTKSTTTITSHSYLEILRALEVVINENYKVEKSVKFYASKLNISPKHLNRVTKTTLNKTTTTLITERVILESKRLIVHSDNTLSQISEILGYMDYAYFSRVFKLKTNTTPIEFKKGYL